MNNIPTGAGTLSRMSQGPYELDVVTLVIIVVVVAVAIYFLRKPIKEFFKRFDTWN